jgi:hypothetical protein
MEFQNVYVLKFVKSFTIYYIKCVCPRIWISMVYVQELRWESVRKFQQENLIKKSFLAASVEKKKTSFGTKVLNQRLESCKN